MAHLDLRRLPAEPIGTGLVTSTTRRRAGMLTRTRLEPAEATPQFVLPLAPVGGRDHEEAGKSIKAL